MSESWAGCEVPSDLLYDLSADVWVRPEAEDLVRVGMTDVAQSRMGKLVQLSWKQRGRPVTRGRPLLVLESAKWVGPMVSPVSGKIEEANEEAFRRDPLLANRDPYGAGWFYLVALSQPDELALLADARAAFEHYRRIIDESGLRCFRCEEPAVFADEDP